MKTATVRHVQHNLAEVLEWVEGGEEVTVTRHNRAVATIVPVKTAPKKVKMPDFLGRMKKNYPHKPLSKKTTEELMNYLREDRF